MDVVKYMARSMGLWWGWGGWSTPGLKTRKQNLTPGSGTGPVA